MAMLLGERNYGVKSIKKDEAIHNDNIRIQRVIRQEGSTHEIETRGECGYVKRRLGTGKENPWIEIRGECGHAKRSVGEDPAQNLSQNGTVPKDGCECCVMGLVGDSATSAGGSQATSKVEPWSKLWSFDRLSVENVTDILTGGVFNRRFEAVDKQKPAGAGVNRSQPVTGIAGGDDDSEIPITSHSSIANVSRLTGVGFGEAVWVRQVACFTV